jgi:hypothetical protein
MTGGDDLRRAGLLVVVDSGALGPAGTAWVSAVSAGGRNVTE